MSDDKEPFVPFDKVDDLAKQVVDIHDVSVRRANAVRAIGFLEGMSAWMWTQVGPDLDDAEVVEFDKCVADIAAYIGLPPREVGAE